MTTVDMRSGLKASTHKFCKREREIMLCNKKRKGVKKLAPKVQRSLGVFYGTKQLKLAVFGSALKKH